MLMIRSVLTAPGAGNIPDVQKPVADSFQLRYIFNFKPHSKHAVSAGQILTGQLLDPNPGGGHGRGDIQKQAVTGNAILLQSGDERLLILIGPADTNPTGSLTGIVPMLGVGAVRTVDGNAEAPRNEADDVISKITEIWENDNFKQDEAIGKWIKMHL